mmetsp:Transcript_3372/g.3339  ORF Transcript_3372/g.3339 Transcript_3372/m.3339 type:complete len:165 (-) Transcript_3372:122-616(-)
MDETILKKLKKLEELNLSFLQMKQDDAGLGSGIVNLNKLKYLSLQENLLEGEINASDDWADFEDLISIELQGNLLTGALPESWNDLPNLEYLDVSRNNLDGTIPILEGAQNLVGLDFSENLFSGDFPEGYFSNTTFYRLQFVNANFNENVEVPEKCIRYHFCLK